MDLVFESTDQTIQIFHLAQPNILNIKFEGQIHHSTYQVAYLKFIQLAKTHHCLKFLYDTQKLENVTLKSRTWYLNQVFPKLFKPGMCSAIVSAEHITNQVATETMKEALFEMGYTKHTMTAFEDRTEAMEWLLTH